MANIYLDTTFFTGLLEDQAGRREECDRILEFEERESSHLFTSVLTVNEFCHQYYDHYGEEEDCEVRVDDVLRQITAVATLYALSEDVNRKAAKILSGWYRSRGDQRQLDADAKTLRWDALHIATADRLEAVRAYAWDKHWKHFPKQLLDSDVEIIAPAACPQPDLPL